MTRGEAGNYIYVFYILVLCFNCHVTFPRLTVISVQFENRYSWQIILEHPCKGIPPSRPSISGCLGNKQVSRTSSANSHCLTTHCHYLGWALQSSPLCSSCLLTSCLLSASFWMEFAKRERALPLSPPFPAPSRQAIWHSAVSNVPLVTSPLSVS